MVRMESYTPQTRTPEKQESSAFDRHNSFFSNERLEKTFGPSFSATRDTLAAVFEQVTGQH
jgi:hypothetical protein